MAVVFRDAPLTLDEHGSYWIVDSNSPTTLLRRSLVYAATPPLSSWLQQFSLTIAGESELALRASSALLYIIAIGVVYLTGRDAFGPIAGGLAALIFAWHPEVVDEVRVARSYGPIVFFAACAFWSAVRWQNRPTSLLAALCWSFSCAALIWTHYTNLAVVAVLNMSLIILGSRIPTAGVRARGLFLIAELILLVAIAPLIPSMLGLWKAGDVFNYIVVAAPPWEVIGPLWWLGLPIGWLLVRAASQHRLTGIDSENVQAWYRQNLRLFGFCSLVPLVLFAIASQVSLETLANPRYRIAISVPTACFLAGVFCRRGGRVVPTIATATAIGFAWLFAGFLPWKSPQLNAVASPAWKEFAEIIERDGQPGEPLFVQSGLVESNIVLGQFADPIFSDYVACRLGRFYLKTPHPRYGLPSLWLNLDANTQLIDYYAGIARAAKESKVDVWVASATDTDLARNSLQGIQQILFDAGYNAVTSIERPSAVLLHYRVESR